jgi:hypothetical protein
MRKISVAAAVFIALAAFCAPASAATSLVSDNGGDLTEAIHSNGTQSGTNLTLQSKPDPFSILFHSSDSLSVTGNGVAKVDGSSGGFTDLAISPISNISFTAFKFNLDIPKGPTGGATNDFTFDADVFFTGGGSLLFDNVDLGKGNGSNRFLITADVSKLIDKIVLSDLTLSSTKSGTTTVTHPDFSAIEQMSFDYVAGVPEPATWAEFILGFGLTGVMLRRRRNQTAAVAIICNG